MYKTILLLTLLYSKMSFACPDISGVFYDADSESNRTVIQNGCESTTWSDQEGETVLLADGLERVLQQEGKMTAYAKVTFTPSDFIIDIRVDYGGANDFDLPTRFLTKYKIDKFNNMVEMIEPFKADGTALGVEYITYRRVNKP